ncbi:MAG: MATE family efflux transporter, partial [Flavobacteriales bacterium]
MNPAVSQFNTSARGILAVSLPISAGIFVQFIVAFIDNYFTAQIDGNAMSAVSFAGLLYITLIMASTGLSNAAQIRIATHLGTGEKERIHQTLGNVLKLSIILGIIQWAVYFFLLPMWVCSTLASQPVAEQMTTFMQYRSFGFLFYTPLLALQSLWSGIGKTRVLALTSLLLAMSTAGLDYLLIFGNDIIPALGVKGAAMATVAAEIIAFIFLLMYTRRNSAHHIGIAAPFNLAEKSENRAL